MDSQITTAAQQLEAHITWGVLSPILAILLIAIVLVGVAGRYTHH
jgi:hypothetical protein